MKTNKEMFNDYLDGIISTAAKLRRAINESEGDEIEVTSSRVGDAKKLEDEFDDLAAEILSE